MAKTIQRKKKRRYLIFSYAFMNLRMLSIESKRSFHSWRGVEIKDGLLCCNWTVHLPEAPSKKCNKTRHPLQPLHFAFSVRYLNSLKLFHEIWQSNIKRRGSHGIPSEGLALVNSNEQSCGIIKSSFSKWVTLNVLDSMKCVCFSRSSSENHSVHHLLGVNVFGALAEEFKMTCNKQDKESDL